MPRLKVIGKACDMRPVWAPRDAVNSAGIQHSRGIVSCEAGAVFLDRHPIRSCVTSVVGLAGKRGCKLLFTTPNLA
jgi:aerobic-type carbon monoxide dehydrogenase small subunit (CoxS/CutS family)